MEEEKMKTVVGMGCVLSMLLVGGGCRQGVSPADSAAEPVESVVEWADLFGTVAGETARIPQLMGAVAVGDEVLLHGKVMGLMEPFVANRAAFVVGDEETLTSCDLLEDDHCQTPWDLCCEDPDAIRAGVATIQVVDDQGAVLRQGLRGVAGLQELSRVRVRGVVAPQSTAAALVVNAERIELL